MFQAKKLFKAVTLWLALVSMIIWSVGLPANLTFFLPSAKAAGGFEVMYLNDGGVTPDVFLGSTTTPEAFLKIKAFETQTGTNKINTLTLRIDQAWDCVPGGACSQNSFTITDLGSLSATTTSGISLWQDDGDGNFELLEDSLISDTSAPADWSVVTDPFDPQGVNTMWQTSFSSLNLDIPTTYGGLTLFAVARAENNLNASPLKKFTPILPQNGIDVTVVSGATITDFPSMQGGQFFGMIALGDEGSGAGMSEGSPVVISEIMTASSTAANYEFVEIYNRSGGDVNLANIQLAYSASDAVSLDSWTATTSLTGTLPANKFFLVGKDGGGVVGADDTYTEFSLDNSAGFVGLLFSDETNTMTADKVAYGAVTTASLAEGGSPAPAPPAGGSLERKAFPDSSPATMVGGIHATKGNAEDSNNNSADFIIRSATDLPGPQNSSASAETKEISSASRSVVINEVLYNTTATGGWIELFNASADPISLQNWKVEIATTTAAQVYTITDAVTLASQNFAVVYWNLAGTNDTDTSDGRAALYTGTKPAMSTLGGDITLKDNTNAIKDYIQYGGSGKTGQSAAATAGQWSTGDFIQVCNYNESIARRSTTGDDYNNSGDWMHMSAPSAGYPNTGGDTTSPSSITNVTFSDADTTNYGLDGNDVRVVFTPASSFDSSFDRYELFILPEGVALDQSLHKKFAAIYGQYQYVGSTVQANYTFTGYGDFNMKYDSANNPLANGSYRAYVVAVDFAGNRSSAVSSPAATITAEAGGDDTIPPMIDHMSVWQAKAEANLSFVVRAGDDRGIDTVELPYKINNGAWGTATSTCAAPVMSDNTGFYACSIAWDAGWDAATVLSYYIKAKDTAASPNYQYMGAYPTNSETTAKSNPINIDFVAAADWEDAGTEADLTGRVNDTSGAPIQDAFVFIEGTATGLATTTAAGAYTIADNIIPAGSQNVKALKSGYMDMMKLVNRGQTADFFLNTGFMNTSSGGSSGGNGVAWSAPMDGMMWAPTNISCSGDCMTDTIPMTEMPILITFFNNMNATTIDDSDASNSGSNIYVTADGLTKVPGKVKYNNAAKQARFYSSTALSANTFYTVVITPNAKDQDGNSVQSNRPSGNYEFSFTTMPDNTDMWGGGGTDFSSFGDGGKFMPPYVKGTNPSPGSFNIPLSAVLTVEFSEAMDATSVSTGIKLYKITSESSWTVTEVTDKSVSVSLDSATKKLATITHTALDTNAANNGWYELRVMGSVKSQLGVWMIDPVSVGCSDPNSCAAMSTAYVFNSSFQVGSSSDTTRPTVTGTFPNNNDGITAGTASADVAMSAIEIGFSEGMNPSTINAQTITLKNGTASVTGILGYDPMSNSAKFSPTNALTPNTAYTLTVLGSTGGVADLSGNTLLADHIITFKTGSADTAAPKVMFANGDDYQIALTFSEPMNASLKTDTDNWAYSVLNPANFYVNALTSADNPATWASTPTLTAPYNTGTGNQVSGLSGVTITYDQTTQTAILKGFTFPASGVTHFQVFADNVKDKSGNAIGDSGVRAKHSGDPTYDDAVGHDNGARAPIQSSSGTYGMLGPGGGGGMMMSGGGAGGAGTTSGGPSGMDMGKMGMFSAGAFPMNAMTGQTSNYFIDLPVTKPLSDGMLITITFPTGFNVSAVAKDPYSPANNDMNDRGAGTIGFDAAYGVGGVASTTLNVVTMKLDVSGTPNAAAGPDGFYDFLHIDLKGVKNSNIAKDFGTSGYTADIKTMSADGSLLESVTTMPFFITQGGSNTLTVVVNCGDTDQDTGTMATYLGSPMTGPMEAISSTFTNGIATSTFTNLSAGQYMLFTDPFLTIGGANYLGKPMPETIQISAATEKNITIEKEGAGAGKAAVTVYLFGDFSTDSAADDVDIFANSPSGFRVKTLTDVGSTNPNTTLYLTEGEWMMGAGIAMPKGPMSGSPASPDWMEPQKVGVIVGIETATGRNLDPDGATDAAIGNTQPVLLTVASTNNFKVGDVITFATGAAAATTTITSFVANTSLTFTPQGNWTTLPAANDVITSVREPSNGPNDKKVNFNISTQATKEIKGFVLDSDGSGIGNAEIYAYQPQGFGGGNTTADTSGKFTLKIGTTGVWTIGAFKPGMPSSKEKSVEVKDNTIGGDGNTTADIYLDGTIIHDATNNNAGTNPLRLKLKRPEYTISGKVLNTGGQSVPYAPVWAYQPTGGGHSDTMTDSSGNYILYVDAGTWRIEADAPNVGWMQYSPDVTVSAASQSNINLRPSGSATYYSVSGTITIDGSAQSYIPLRAALYDANGNYQGRDYGASTDSNGGYTLSLPAGYYRIDTWTQNYGEVELVYDQVASSQANINVNAATTTADILVAAADLQTISLQFNNGAAAQTGFLNVDEVTFNGANPIPTGYHFSTKIDGLNATSTIKIKGASAGKYYFFGLDVPGYGFFSPDTASRQALSNDKDCIKVTDAARAVYFTLPNASTEMITVSGTVTDGSVGLANAWVWIGSPNTGYHTGAETGSAGTFSITVPKLESGTYNLGADKSGYMSSAPASVSATTASADNTVALGAAARTIVGYVKNDSGTNIPNAYVWAKETTTGNMAHTPADASGYYSLPVTNGTWSIMAGADGYKDGNYKVNNTKTNVTVAGAIQTPAGSIDIVLETNADWTMKTKSKSITPSSGGTVDDTAASATGVKITAPPNALGSSQSSGNLGIQETSAVTETTSFEPLGGIGKVITATDNSGQAITNLSDYLDIEIVYYKANIEAMNLVDYSKLKTQTLGYWDNTANNWVNLNTTRKAYYKLAADATEWTMKSDSATQTGYEEFIDTLAAGSPSYYDYKLVFIGKTNHLTVFSAINPPDALAPAAPASLAQTSGGGTSVGLSWAAVTTNADATSITDLLGYELYRSTDGTTYTQVNTSDISGTTYTDTGRTAFTSYYYKITAADDGGNESAYSSALQVCSTNTVSNGLVAADCSISCNTGYTRNGNTCAANAGSAAPSGNTTHCSSVVYDEWQASCAADGFQYRNIKSFSPSGCSLSASQETERKRACPSLAEEAPVTEKAKEIIKNTKETVAEVKAKTEETAKAFTEKLTAIAYDAAEIIKASVSTLLEKLGLKRNITDEQKTADKFTKMLIKNLKVAVKDQSAITNFISYGTETTLKLGAGERAGVLNSYKSAFGRLPAKETEWSDAIKIANGRWPSELNKTSEANATLAFRKIYKRAPDRKNSNDDAAVTVIAYGLRPAQRNVNSEAAAIKSFKAIYGYPPVSATAWDIVRAIAYSGAKR
ncbi:MAG: carboxypeptidase regulatory-like domain-containing protein [Patescibacteria group bacterium]|jgi:protocatechuate 3,4-dioxygenase beta subunit